MPPILLEPPKQVTGGNTPLLFSKKLLQLRGNHTRLAPPRLPVRKLIDFDDSCSCSRTRQRSRHWPPPPPPIARCGRPRGTSAQLSAHWGKRYNGLHLLATLLGNTIRRGAALENALVQVLDPGMSDSRGRLRYLVPARPGS